MTQPDHRHFLPWNAPALPQAAAFLAARYTTGSTLDLGGVLIAVPGGRAGRRLKEIFVDLTHAGGLRLVPPHIATVGALPELLYIPDQPLADDATSHRAWAAALRTLDEADRAALFPHAPDRDDVRGWISLGRQLHALQHEVAGAALTFDDVAARCDDSLLFDDSDRWTRLARAQQHYAATLARAGRADRDLARLRAATTRTIACDRDLWLIGLAELPVITRLMVQQVAADSDAVGIIVHAPADHAEAFDALGCVITAAWTDRGIPLAEDRITIVEHPSNQATVAIAAISSFGDALAPDDVVIGVPDEEVVPYLEQRLARAGAQARYAGGTPAARHGVFRALEAIADLLTEKSFESLAALARHPAVGEWLRVNRRTIDHASAARFAVHDAWIADLDSFCCERLPARVTDGLTGTGGRGRGVVEAVLAGVMSDALAGGLRGARPLNDWMPIILDVVIELYGSDPLDRDIPAERRLVEASRRLREAAAAQHGVSGMDEDVCDAGTAIRIILDDTAGDAIPADAGDNAIELLGWLELHLDDAPAAVITGMNEPHVPQAVNAHAFLPNALRAKLGIEDNDRRYARDAYQLTAMLNARRHLHVIAGRRTVLGDPVRPSRLLLSLDGRPLAGRVVRFLEGSDTPTTAPSPAAPPSLSPAMAAQSGFRLPPQPEIVLDDVPDVLSVTDFARIVNDAYAFALSRVMGWETDDDSARELDGRRFGNLGHRVLEQFSRSAAAASEDARTIRDELELLLDNEVATSYGDGTATSVRLQVEQLRLRLRALARWQAQWAAEGWRIVATEAATEESGVPFDVDGISIRIKGRIDRIDYNAGLDAWAVFDYKTGEYANLPGETHRKKRSGEWIDLQLPLYRFLLPHVRTADGNAVVPPGAAGDVRLGYILLCGEPDKVGGAFADWSDGDLDSATEAARVAVRILRSNIFAFEDRIGPYASADMKALLGFGRLVLEDEDLVPAEGA